jgi:hypothetical protein
LFSLTGAECLCIVPFVQDKEIRAEVDVALAAALAAGPPPNHELMDDIFLEDADARAVELINSRVVGQSPGPGC